VKSRLAVLGVLGAILAGLLVRVAGPTRPSGPPPGRVASGSPTLRAVPPRERFEEVATRNPFVYAEPQEAGAPESSLGVEPNRDPETGAGSADGAPNPPSSPGVKVRLIGLVWRGGVPKAALAIGGEVIVLGAGEREGAYALLELSEAEGVRLLGPDGELALGWPE